MKSIYGPVKSRRLGYSLGISIVPHKTCSFDCIYCELGANLKRYASPDYYIGADEILEQLNHFFLNFKGKIDYLTITGYGEPTLNKNLPDIAKNVKEKYGNYKLALLTNSSFLDMDFVIESYKYFDLIMPSLDAVSERAFNIVDRPDCQFTAQKIIDNIKILRNNFSKSLELEILFCDGLNTGIDEIILLYNAAKEIKPDKIWINTVVRGPAYQEAKPISEALRNNLTIYFNTALKKDEKRKGSMKLEELIENLKSNPMTYETIEFYTEYSQKELFEILNLYEKRGLIAKRQLFNLLFYEGIK